MDYYQKTKNNYDLIASSYAEKIKDKSPIQNIKKFLNFIKGNLILDIGCAAGRDTKIIHDQGFKVIGIDFSEKLLAIAKINYPQLNFIHADMRKLPFDDQYFDGIYASGVFHHLKKEDMPKALLEFKRVLKQAGILHISTKSGSGIHIGADKYSGKTEREFTLLSIEELDEMISNAGFKKIEIYHQESSRKNVLWNCAFFKNGVD